MKRTIVTLSTVALVGLSSAFFTETAHAEKSVSQIQDERTEVKADLSDAEAKIADVLLDLEDLNKEIARVDNALANNKKQMKNTQGNITDQKKQVDKLEDEIKALEKKIEERFAIMKKRMVSYQKNGGDIQYLEVLFGSQSFGDFVNRASAVSTISDADADLMKQQEADKKKVEKKQAEVEDKLDELKDMKAEQKAIEDTILNQKKENDKAKQKLQDKEAKLKEMKANLENKDSDLADLEAEVRKNMEEVNNETSDTSGDSDAKGKENAVASTLPAKSESTSNSETKAASTSKATSKASNTSKQSAVEPTIKPAKAKAKPSTKATTATVSSGRTGSAITAGNKYIGHSTYVFGGGRTAYDIEHGLFDCSGFVSWAYKQEGISLPASTDGLATVGKKVSYSDIQPGDLVFFDTYKHNGHVGIYIGGGQFIGSQDSTGVAKVSMSNPYWSGVFKGHVRRVK